MTGKLKLIERREFLKTVTVASGIPMFYGPWKHNRAFASRNVRPIKIGLTHDATGQYGMSGQSDLRGCIMAIEEANARGGILGRKIVYEWRDTETDAHVGAKIAVSLINEYEVSAIVGAVHSDVAAAIGRVAQNYGCVYINSNSSSPKQSAADCHRVKFVFDANSKNFALASTRFAIQSYGTRWLILANDYEWGHRTAKVIQAQAESLGAEIVDVLMVPVGTRNYINVLKQIKSIRPDVVATAIGGNDYIPLRAQTVDMELNRSPAWVNNQQDWPDHYASTEASIFGIFGTTWYHRLDLPGVKEFVARYQARWPDVHVKVPGNVFYNGYMATRELLSAMEREESLNNIRVIQQLEQLHVSARDRMQHNDAYMNPASHHLQQTVYVAGNNAKDRLKDSNDFYRILHWMDPKEVLDPGEGGCSLESLADTPVYEV